MLAKLDSFPFKMFESHFKQINEVFTWHFAEQKQIGHDSTYHDVNGRTHTLTLKGLLVQHKTRTLDPLIKIADRKKPVRLTTVNDDYYVLIKSLNRGKDKFNPDGSFMVQTFDITLQRVNGRGGFDVIALASAVGGVKWQKFT